MPKKPKDQNALQPSLSLWRSACVSAAVAAVAAAHLTWPGRFDETFMVLLALALVPWLAPFLDRVKIDKFEIIFRQLKREIDEARGEARSSRRVVETLAEGLLTDTSRGSQEAAVVPPDAELDALIAEYKQVQKGMKRGPAKTARLTRLMSRLTVLGPRLRDLDVREALKGKDQGKRVAAYAALYARPDGALLPDLVDAVTGTKQRPFAQYWGIKAIGKALAVADPAEARAAIFRLEEFSRRGLTEGTDRHRELSHILREFTGGRPSPDAGERRVP
jgi:hypothetical protein